MGTVGFSIIVLGKCQKLIRKKYFPANVDEALHDLPPDELEPQDEVIMSYDRSDFYGPNHWGKISKFCDGFHQSPVNLYVDQARKLYGQPLIISGIDAVPSNITITNSGHSASIKFGFADGNPIQLSGGPLEATYIADNIHFHWGASDSAGSEHTIDAKRYSAELHLVTFNSNYGEILRKKFNPCKIFNHASNKIFKLSIIEKFSIMQ